MKKIFLTLLVLSSLFANEIKDNKLFVNLNIGKIKNHNSTNTAGIKAGYYFYTPNKYKVSNRISIGTNIVDSSGDFYIYSFMVDWLFNNSTSFVPFVGLNLGYLYFEENNIDTSSGIWGAQGGLLYNLTSSISLEIEATYQKTYENKNVWNKPLKKIDAGIEFSF